MKQVQLAADIIQQLLDDARAHRQVEICGLISIDRRSRLRIYPISNIADSPGRRFEMDPGEQIAAMRRMREQDENLFAIYHSHPDGPAEPSATDIACASYPETLYLIIAPRAPHGTDIRGFYLGNGEIDDVALLG